MDYLAFTAMPCVKQRLRKIKTPKLSKIAHCFAGTKGINGYVFYTKVAFELSVLELLFFSDFFVCVNAALCYFAFHEMR